jgi:hypothetical protein
MVRRILAQEKDGAGATGPGARARGRTRGGRGFFLILVLASVAGILAGCGRHSDVDPTKARSRIQRSVRQCLEERGGHRALVGVAAYRAEGLITLIPERRVAKFVRWYDPAGRMRTELREKDRGEVRIISEAGTWSGADDRSLAFGESTLLDILSLAVARRDFPAPFVANEDSLELADHDKKKRTVLRARSSSGVLVDYSLDSKKSKLQVISARAEEEPDFTLRVELKSFRKIQGARFPFKETIYRGKQKLAVVRFRIVEPVPDIPEALFVPRVTPADP